jgi:hypothetical protein
VLDSLKKANFDTTALATVQRQVAQLKGTNANTGGGRGGFGGGGGGFGGRGGAGGGFSSCEHPLTQWDAFCARPVEVPFVQGGGRGGAPAAAGAAVTPAPGRGGRGARGNASGADIDPVARIWGIIGMTPPAGAAGGRGGGGGRGGFGGGQTASTGDYLATLTVGGQTFKQTFRVENTGMSSATSPFGGVDEGHR